MLKAERHLLPNGLEVLYFEDGHRYVVDGKEVPSITQIISNHNGNEYANVNKALLEACAQKGTQIHDELSTIIEARFNDPDFPIGSDFQEVINYFEFIEPIFKIIPKMSEKVVALYDLDGNVVACGRFDLLCTVDGALTLTDFKTTSSIHTQSVNAQLNLYGMAAYQSGYLTKEQYDSLKFGVIHLNGSTAKYKPITKFADTYYLQFII